MFFLQTDNNWQTTNIPFQNCIQYLEAKKLTYPYNGKQLEEITFLIGNKKNETLS
jgi:hypothetical protein